jgi:hypothetical protein
MAGPGDVPGRKERETELKIKKIKLAVAEATVTAAMLATPLAVGTANAGTYTLSYIDRCADVAQQLDCFQLGPTPPTPKPGCGSTAP